jgi:hypothetical protein
VVISGSEVKIGVSSRTGTYFFKGKFMNQENSNQGNPRIGIDPEEIVLFPLEGGNLDDQVNAWILENP